MEVAISFSTAPWNNSLEPNQGNVQQWLNNLKSKFQPLEQERWNESNIDTLFYAGSQTFINNKFGLASNITPNQYYFNLIQQPVNMVTGYERQHRKNFNYIPCEGADPQTTDQYTKLITTCANRHSIHEMKSKAKELAAVSGMVLVQPYLDFSGDDQAQGDLKVKIWEFNSFLMDPYWRNDINEAQFIWCQEYISKQEAEERYPDKAQAIQPMSGTPQRYGSFYFLPENYNMARNDLMVMSYVWYKWTRKKKRLYSRSRNQFFDFGKEADLDMILYNIPDMEVVTVKVPCWKLATVLNDQLMSLSENPLGVDSCPMIPYYWNYEPHQSQPNLRVRSLVRPMRSPQYLFNHKVITNADITEATINAGWKRKVGAVANEDNLKKSGQGWDVIINEDYEMTDVEKIVPSGVPESDLALADQFMNLIYATSGINMENWAGQADKQISALTAMIKSAANLLVFQKYFDQWDHSDKQLGEVLLQITLNNWTAEKVALIIGEEPSPYFYSKIFSKFQVLVEESDLTPTQQNLQAQQMLDINQVFGREVFPPSMIIPKLNITGKGEIIPFLQQQEQQAAAVQAEEQNIQHAVEEAKLKEIFSKAANNIAAAKERYGRFESNIGLLEERMAEVSKNRSLSTKAKMEALEKMVDVIERFGALETSLKMDELKNMDYQQQAMEENDKERAHQQAEYDEFISNIMGNSANMSQKQGQQPQQQQLAG